MRLLHNKIEKKLQSTDFQCVGIDELIKNLMSQLNKFKKKND